MKWTPGETKGRVLSAMVGRMMMTVIGIRIRIGIECYSEASMISVSFVIWIVWLGVRVQNCPYSHRPLVHFESFENFWNNDTAVNLALVPANTYPLKDDTFILSLCQAVSVLEYRLHLIQISSIITMT